MEDVNWAPWSEVKRAGTLKREIQVEIKACAQDSVDMEVNGMASSGQSSLECRTGRRLKEKDPPGQCEHEQNVCRELECLELMI